jgi:hypothetical protein
MLKFSSIRIDGDTVHVTGPFNPDGASEVISLSFMLAQYPGTAQGQGRIQGSGWTGEAPAGNLHAGRATAVGVAVLVDPGDPPGMQTFTWCEVKDVDAPA